MTTVRQILDDKGYEVWTVSPEATVFDAFKLMADNEIGAVVVVESGTAIGILSERDYARKVTLQNRSCRDTSVKDVMSMTVYGVRFNTTAEECMNIMTNKRFRHLPVFDAEKLVGLVSIGDIVKAVIDEQKTTIDDLESYIMGKYPR